MSYRKLVVGNANQSNETASNNKIHSININDGRALAYVVIFVIVLASVTIGFMWIAHPDILSALVTGTFVGGFVVLWLVVVQWLRRDNSHTTTVIAVNQATQERALLETHILAMTDQYILYKDHNGDFQFRGTVSVTENRHFPAIEAPKQEIDATEAILEMHNNGTKSAREIKRWLDYQMRDKPKSEHVSQRQINKILDTYRPGWQNDSKKVIDAEEYPADE